MVYDDDRRRAPERWRSVSRRPEAISDADYKTAGVHVQYKTVTIDGLDVFYREAARAAHLSCCCCTASRPLLTCFGT